MADGTPSIDVDATDQTFDKLKRFLTKNRPKRARLLKPANGSYQRIVMMEICQSGKSPNIQVHRLDIDFSPKGDFVAKSVTKIRRGILAATFARYLMDTKKSLGGKFPSACEIARDIWGDAESKKIFPGCKGTPRAVGASNSDYRPLASNFDIKFNGPTLVIVRSSVDFLVFDPSDPLFFNSMHDSIYYREDRLSDDYRTLSYINAYDKGNFEPYKLPNPAPYNQQHKIDYGMLLCSYACPYGDDSKPQQWLVTPLRIDPPHENDGVGG